MFFITLLAAVGMSHILADGSILAGWRGRMKAKEEKEQKKSWLLEMVTCYQCNGFWTGALLGLITQPISWGLAWYWSLPLWLVVTPVVTGFASSCLRSN
jgi:uncharacterized membrane protein